jgi:hypothetical protein
MLPVVGAAAHHALPCLLTLSANGTLFSWKLTTHPDKKISIHPGGTTTSPPSKRSITLPSFSAHLLRVVCRVCRVCRVCVCVIVEQAIRRTSTLW